MLEETAQGAEQAAGKGPSCRIRRSTSPPALGWTVGPRERENPGTCNREIN